MVIRHFHSYEVPLEIEEVDRWIMLLLVPSFTFLIFDFQLRLGSRHDEDDQDYDEEEEEELESNSGTDIYRIPLKLMSKNHRFLMDISDFKAIGWISNWIL